MSDQSIIAPLQVGDPLTITAGKPRWWDLRGWFRYLRFRMLYVEGGYVVTEVTHSVIHLRPDEPTLSACVWYRNWEVGYNYDAAYWTNVGWEAYKGGCDLDAPRLTSPTWEGILAEIDDAEDEA